MNNLLLIFTFLLGYLINMYYITVLYHRCLAHNSCTIGKNFTRWVFFSGIWVTGIDPKAWVCMHRMHHSHSDKLEDPHSPLNVGIWGVFRAQYQSYRKIIEKLKNQDSIYTSIVSDLTSPIHWLQSKKNLGFIPYLVQFILSIIIGFYVAHP